MGVMNIYYYDDFLLGLIGITLVIIAAGWLMQLLKKNEKTAEMLERIKERLRIFIEKSTVEKKKDK